jgi:hypothetical protein
MIKVRREERFINNPFGSRLIEWHQGSGKSRVPSPIFGTSHEAFRAPLEIEMEKEKGPEELRPFSWLATEFS